VYKLLRKLLILSAVFFVVVLVVYAVLYFTDFGKNRGFEGEDVSEEPRQLNIDHSLVAAYSTGLGEDGSETIVSLYPSGDATVGFQSPESSGLTLGLWERVGDKVRFEFISTNSPELPTSDFELEIKGDNLFGLGDREFKRLTEDNLTTLDSEEVIQEGPEGLAVKAAADYVQNVLGGTDVEVTNSAVTSASCSNCFTIALKYLKGATPSTIELQVVNGVVVR